MIDIKLYPAFFLSLAIIASGCISGSDLTEGTQNYETSNIEITASRVEQVGISAPSGSVLVSAEIADTPERWQRGLMARTSLGENDGMLFAFDVEQQQAFWMKDTLIPLDIIFISADSKIIDIKKDFQPCQADPCPTYTSAQPARYALEVNAGFSDTNGISAGQGVTLPVL